MNQDKTYCDFHITCLDGEDCDCFDDHSVSTEGECK